MQYCVVYSSGIYGGKSIMVDALAKAAAIAKYYHHHQSVLTGRKNLFKPKQPHLGSAMRATQLPCHTTRINWLFVFSSIETSFNHYHFTQK